MDRTWADMSPREQDAAIAGWLGWSHIHHADDSFIGRAPGAIGHTHIPYFTEDAMAARIMEDEIERRGLSKMYVEALGVILGVDQRMMVEHSASTFWMVLRATPAQRCKATWRAMGGR